jgi:hypothetical protein
MKKDTKLICSTIVGTITVAGYCFLVSTGHKEEANDLAGGVSTVLILAWIFLD